MHISSHSTLATKFFEPTADTTQFRSSTEKKVYLVASILIGVMTLGIPHAIYQVVKKVTLSDPDSKKIETTINEEGEIEIVPKSKYNVSGLIEFQNKRFDKRLVELEGANTLASNTIGFTFRGQISDEDPVAKIYKDIHSKQIYFQMSNTRENIPNITVNTRLLEKGESLLLEPGENEIMFQGQLIFKFNLPLPNQNE